MSTKLSGAFIAALALVAFAVLPAAASATAVPLRDKNGNDPGSIVLTSNNLEFGSGPLALACEESEITATRRGVGRYTPRSSRFEGGGTMSGPNGDELCPVIGTGGRVELRVRPVNFREDLTFRERANGSTMLVTEARFTLDFWDRSIIPNAPFRRCDYEMSVDAEVDPVNRDEIHINEVPVLEAGGDRGPVAGCPALGLFLEGDARITDRNGDPVEVD